MQHTCIVENSCDVLEFLILLKPVTYLGCSIALCRGDSGFYGIDFTENDKPSNETYGEYSAHYFARSAQTLIGNSYY